MLLLTDERFANDPADASCVDLDAATSRIVVQLHNCFPDKLPPDNFITNLNPTGNKTIGGKSHGKPKTLSDPSGEVLPWSIGGTNRLDAFLAGAPSIASQ